MKKFTIFDLISIGNRGAPTFRASTFHSRFGNRKSRSGMALVVCLALIVLITAAALAFFARATANRIVETSRANQVEAEQLAKSAGDYIVSGFLREIRDRSTSTTNNGVVVYQPTTNTFSLPQRTLPAAIMSNTDFANLTRRSCNDPQVNGIGETNASGDNSATPAKNGRTVGMNRWNAPQLLTGGGFTDTNQLPNWIYVNSDGNVSNTSCTNSVGRFAYAVYNVGGLLDVNVAGHPTTMTTDDLAKIKGTLAGADLSMIPDNGTAADADAFVKVWRNATTANSYVTGVTNSATNGFLHAQQGDNRVLNRQDLIKLAKLGAYGITTNALPYLTTFSRTADGPSFTPKPSRPKVQNQTPALPTYGMDDSFNPSLIAIRVTASFTRADGSQAKIGEPLLKKKFPLSRLALVTDSATANNSSDIYRFFGLTRAVAGDTWTYNHGAADRILQLNEVAAAGREPDFFELLQACIPIGSLGKSRGKTCAYVTAPGVDVARDIYPKYQILQIGANLIDQYDMDSYPTAIQLVDENSFTFSGIENLPYLTRMFSNLYKDMGTDPVNPSGPAVEFMHYFLHPEVWNPHKSASVPPSPSTAGNIGPNEFRFVMDGNYTLSANGNISAGQSTFSTNGTRAITFSGAADFSEPKLLNPPYGTATDPRDTKTPSSGSLPSGTAFVGMLMGSFTPPSGDWDKNFIMPAPLSYHLQYRRNGVWFTYNTMRFHMNAFYVGGSTWLPVGYYGPPSWYLIARSDPRVERFGFMMRSNWQPNGTMRPDYTNDGYPVWDTDVTRYPGWYPAEGGMKWYYFLGALTGNKPSSNPTSGTWYQDADGVNRLGDAAFSSGATGQPMQTGNLDSRPVILNRPFRSVAEMGYAGRDLPWKTLDLFTDQSADGALLDAFTVNENTSGSDLEAGVVDLNAMPVPVLKAILTGATKTDSAASAFTPPEVQNLATAIRTILDTNPLENKASLPTKILSAPAVGSAFSPASDAAIKVRREAVARALGDVGQVRTWNLLVDCIVQSGQFVSGTAASDFVGTAEKRCWISLALDRPTATILSSQTENILE